MQQNIVFNIARESFENSLLPNPYVAHYQTFSWHDRCRSTLQKVISMSNTKGKQLQFEIQRKNITTRSPRKEENKLQAAPHNILRYKMRCGQCNFTYVIHFISNANAISLITLQNKRGNFITSASAIRHAKITKHPICSRTNRNHHFTFRWE